MPSLKLVKDFKYPKSPLRYAGGKSKAVKHILNFIPKNTKEIVSPFFGGGSVEIALASNGVKVHGYDIFPQLVIFWNELLKSPLELSKEVQKYFPMEKERFYKLQKSFENNTNSLDIASIFFALNRSSFSGLTLSGGMSSTDTRFTQSSIDYLASFSVDNLSVQKLSFKESLNKHPSLLAYLDPPYLIKSTLYGIKGNTHKDFDHAGLFNILKNRDNWIMSYNDCPKIREMYKDYFIVNLDWKYGMSKDKNSKEIIILSLDLAKSNVAYEYKKAS